MHVARSLDEAIALGTSVGNQTAVRHQMRVHLTNFLKIKFGPAFLLAEDKPLGPEELNDLLAEIIGRER